MKRGHNYSGLFLTLDGPEGGGKTTQLRLLNKYLENEGYEFTNMREPGGTLIGEQIRRVLLDPDNRAADKMSITTEMMLFMAARAQLVEEEIIPSLERGTIVGLDRFYDSTMAYQGYAGGLDIKHIENAIDAACQRARPDRTYILDVDGETAAPRLSPLLDRMEKKGIEFHKRVRNAFFDIAEKNPERIKLIDTSNLSIEEVHQEVIKDLEKYLDTFQLRDKLNRLEQLD